jgi:G:T-mismatch repair DNA endonuclease (very short patch repair protein)
MQSPEFQKKFFDKYEEEHGYRYPIQSPNNKYGGNISKPQLKVLNELKNKGYKLKKEFTIYPYRVDMILEKTNKIIEVYGDYWHANPAKYKANDKIQFPRQTNITHVNEIWERDSKRISYIKKAGYDVFIAWEHDINKNFEELIIDIEKFLNNGNDKN